MKDFIHDFIVKVIGPNISRYPFKAIARGNYTHLLGNAHNVSKPTIFLGHAAAS